MGLDAPLLRCRRALGSRRLAALRRAGARGAGGGLVLVNGGLTRMVRVWELTDGRKPQDYNVDRDLWLVWLGWSAGGEPLAVSREKDGLRLHRLASGRSRRFECRDLEPPK